MTPLVSVIVLSYERPEWCETAVRSVLAQGIADVEVIVSDDSRDGRVAAMIDAIGDPRVRYVQGPRQGQLANIRAAYPLARAALVGVLHDDDYWYPDLLERLAGPMLADASLDLAFGDFDHVDPDGALLPEYAGTRTHLPALLPSPLGEPHDVDALTRSRVAVSDRGLSPFQATIVRRDALDGLDISDESGSVVDYWICAHLAKTTRRWLYVPSPLMGYRIHGSSVAASMNDLTAVRWCVEHFLQDPFFGPVSDGLRRYLRDYERAEALAALALGRRVEARKKLASLRTQFGPRDRAIHFLVTRQPVAALATRWLWRRNPRFSFAAASQQAEPGSGASAKSPKS